MEKQHNRGQDGAGVVNIKLDLPPGKEYIFRARSNENDSIRKVFDQIRKPIQQVEQTNPELIRDVAWAKSNVPFAGELFLGHLRYGTFGKNNIENVHPVMRQSSWESKNLVLAGNFNLTNVDEVIQKLINLGQHPRDFSDTVTILENIGHFLDEENERLFRLYRNEGYSKKDISLLIHRDIDIQQVLIDSCKRWDGGYALAGMIGHGDAFVLRDPHGIRPAYYYHDDEIAVVASERPVIQTVMNIKFEDVRELDPGHAIIVRKSGQISVVPVNPAGIKKACSFERIYFSRGSDAEIYEERKKLGELIVPHVLKSVNYDLRNTVFSFIPNTAEIAFYGMVKGVEDYIIKRKVEILSGMKDFSDPDKLLHIISERPRVEKIAIKDIKLRTFITQDNKRDDLVKHVYDVTYGTVKSGQDNLIVIDDSIVRGTTLKQSIIKILSRLEPKKIVIVSSSPQIRYPDCYGIDMARLDDFVAFHAAIELLKEIGKESIIQDVYKKCKAQINLPKEEIQNFVKEIYHPFAYEHVSRKISQLLTPDEILTEVEIVYQTVENLHVACPKNLGDWYFTGDYPTPGGNKVVNQAFINYVEGRSERAY